MKNKRHWLTRNNHLNQLITDLDNLLSNSSVICSHAVMFRPLCSSSIDVVWPYSSMDSDVWVRINLFTTRNDSTKIWILHALRCILKSTPEAANFVQLVCLQENKWDISSPIADTLALYRLLNGIGAVIFWVFINESKWWSKLIKICENL